VNAAGREEAPLDVAAVSARDAATSPEPPGGPDPAAQQPDAAETPSEPSRAVASSDGEVGTSAAPVGASVGVAPAVAGTRQGMTPAEVLATLRSVFSAGAAVCCWVARIDGIGSMADALPGDLTGCSEGRAWSVRAEVRWKARPGDGYAMLYLGASDQLPEGFVSLTTGLSEISGGDSGELYLWGTRGADGRYRSTRLGRPLEYPALVGEHPEPRLPYRLLVDAAGLVRYVRLALREMD
jgi:hypothetical protein